MTWFGFVVTLLSLLDKVTDELVKRNMIAQFEADLVHAVARNGRELKRDAKAARKSVDADIALGKLRDDDGHRRD